MDTPTKNQTPAATNLAATQQKIEHLFKLQKITLKDMAGLSSLECQYLSETCTTKINQLKDTERDIFLDKISDIIVPITKCDIWDYNHAVINNAIATLMRQSGTMPARKEIAEKTGLSRQTIAKHLREYHHHPQFEAAMDQFKLMAPNVLTSVFKNALKGDMKAARLYLETVGTVTKQQTGTVINEQNNYIQVNNTILSQENLNRLTAEQLNQIESIVKNRR